MFVYQHEIVVRNLELGAHFTNFAVFCFFKYHFFFLFNLHKQLKATLYALEQNEFKHERNPLNGTGGSIGNLNIINFD